MTRWNSYQKNTLAYDPEQCISCGRCIEVCPHQVFARGPERVILKLPENCMECGACQKNCPVGAIAVESGVGCAYAMIKGALNGTGIESCDCGGDESSSGCCG